MEVVFAKSARAEILHAARYYEDEVEGLGRTFLAYLEKSVAEIARFPLASRAIGKDFRRFLVPRFPFGIIYRIEHGALFVAAVMHLKRKPFYWESE